MKMYPLYEFPPSMEVLEKILIHIDYNQPISNELLKSFVSELIGKRSSRTNITIKELKKLNIIEGTSEFSLTWETQLYLDLKRPVDGLILYLVYQIPELFKVCKDICFIDPEFKLSKPKLLEKLYELGYEEGKLSTNREKLFGLIRIIKICQRDTFDNPFEQYSNYISFLKHLQKLYLILTNNQYDKNITLVELQNEMIKEKNIEKKEFEDFISQLYFDPILSSRTSFSTVNNDFASKGYVQVADKKFYYLKIKENFKL
ncbi:hypothetical protein COI51_21745 [Bacillus toyonensis]|uniref:hypothetical protein n=3 Tax=Bacillus cereus group TaxID=86661 RepID=UPI000BF0CDA9|nr:hypothetical protein [Bacillus toyonensis]PEM13358.1 hypothetical protein CN616_25205 [Bacillus toyonensis]PGA39906.1 hypothetical protein COL85_26880 [Bacillus toyonensis]PGB24965.1 hypothetical protein COM06_19465 [Bacillus toyonensis]PGC36719.1 hypothetical protein COM10_12610 [Bacillus toyonensis]PHF81971.1 hypothetical protein COI51_21745 [Bacillus toyonensis]